MAYYVKEPTLTVYTATAIKVLHFDLPKGWDICFHPHWHERMELIRVHQGEMIIELGSNTVTLHAGEIILLPPRVPHKGNFRDCELIYDVLMFDVRSFYNDSKICKAHLPAIYDGRVQFETIIQKSETIRCFDAIYENAEKDSLEVVGMIYCLLAHLLEHHVVDYKNEPKQDIVREIALYIEANFAQELSIASLCTKFGYSEAHLSRKFKEVTGLAPMKYLEIYRLEIALKMLEKQEYNVSEIARQCGFNDSNYFTRRFKAHYGLLPSQVRKQYRS